MKIETYSQDFALQRGHRPTVLPMVLEELDVGVTKRSYLGLLQADGLPKWQEEKVKEGRGLGQRNIWRRRQSKGVVAGVEVFWGGTWECERGDLALENVSINISKSI